MAQSDEGIFLNSRQVKERYANASDMWIFRRLHDDSGFPEPIYVRGRRFWRLADLIKWERGVPKPRPGRPRKQPAQEAAFP
jgi:hypothetical protein